MPISRIDNEGLTGPIGGRRNLIINGAMNVAQRATSVLASGSNGFKTVDRFRYTRSGTVPLWDFTQGTSGPNGFSYTFKATLDTAHTLASNSIAYIHSKLEAQDLQHLRYGTSDAKTLTLSFWVKSSNTGTFIVELLHSDASQYQNLAYTISSANTWEYKTLTYVGNTSTAINNDTGTGLETRFILTAGSDYTGGSLNTGWNATSVSSGRYTGQIDLAATAANYIEITGVQLEVGTVATEFEHRSFGEELALCQRYYHTTDHIGGSTAHAAHILGVFTTIRGFFGIDVPVAMRAFPSISMAGSIVLRTPDLTTEGTLSSVSPYATLNNTRFVLDAAFSTSTANTFREVSIGSNGAFLFDAEL